MSNVVDNRVVSIEFDNAKFEKNVKTSVSTLKHLDKTLNDMSGSAKSLESIDRAINNMDFSNLASNIDKMANKFSFFKEVASGVARSIGDSLVDMANRAVRSISMIDQISAGWDKYASKTESVQTIMSSTGMSIEAVSKQLERLNWYTDETSYNYTEMASNIAKFTAQNVGLEESVTAMEGIANWAAQAGQKADAAGRAMYNISQAMGLGFMGTADWKSIELANMATTTFKKTVLETAEKVGTLTKVSEGLYKTVGKGSEVSVTNFREALSEGWFDTNVMRATFNEYGKFSDKLYELTEITGKTATELLDMMEAEKNGTITLKEYEDAVEDTSITATQLKGILQGLNGTEFDLSREAFKLGQEAKTYADAIGAFQDAFSTSWMRIFELIFGNYEEAKVVWTEFTNMLYDIFVEPVNSLESLLKGAFASDWDKLVDNVNDAGVKTEEFYDALAAAKGESREAFDDAIKGAGGYEKAIKEGVISTEMLDKAFDALAGTVKTTSPAEQIEAEVKKLNDAVFAARRGELGNGADRKKAVEDFGWNYEYFQDLIVKTREDYQITQKDLENMGVTFETLAERTEESANKLRDLKNEAKGLDLSKLSGGDNLRQGLVDLMGLLDNISSAIQKGFADILPESLGDTIYSILEQFAFSTEKLKGMFEEGMPLFQAVRDTFSGIFSILSALVGVIGGVISLGVKLLNAFLVPIGKVLFAIIGKLGYAVSYLFKKGSGLRKVYKGLADAIDYLSGFLNALANVIVNWLYSMQIIESINNAIDSFVEFLGNACDAIAEFASELYDAFKGSDLYKSIETGLSYILSYFDGIGTAIGDFFMGNYTLSSLAEEFAAFGDEMAAVFGRINQYLLSDEFKNTDLYKFLKLLETGFNNFCSTIRELKDSGLSAVSNGISSIGDSIREIVPEFDSMSLLGKIGTIITLATGALLKGIGELVVKIRDKIKNTDWSAVFASIVDKIRGLVPKIQNAAAVIVQALRNAFNKIKDPNFRQSVADNISKIFQGLNIDFGDFSPEGIAKTLFSIIKTAGTILGRLVGGMFTGVGAIAKAGYEFVKAFVQGIVDSIPGFPGFYSALKEAFGKFFDGFSKFMGSGSGIDKLMKTSKVATYISLALKGFKGLGSVGTFSKVFEKLFTGIGGLNYSIKKMGRQVANILQNVSGILKQVKGAVASYKHLNNSKALINVGKALLLVVLALAGVVGIVWVVTKMLEKDAAKVREAAVIVGVLLLVVGGVLVALYAVTSLLSAGEGNKLAWTFASIALLFVGIAGSMWIFAKAMEEITKIDADAFKLGFQRLAMFLVGIAAVVAVLMLLQKLKIGKNFLTGNGDLKGIGIAMLGVAGALYICSRAIEKLAKLKLTESQANGIAKIMAALGISLAAISAAAGFGKFKFSNGLGLVLAALAVKMITSLVVDVKAMMDEAQDLNIVWATVFVAGFLTLLGLLATSIGKSGFNLSSGLGLIAMVVAVRLIKNVIEAFAEVPWEKFHQQYAIAAGCLIALSLAAIAIGKLNVDGDSVLKSAAGMVLMAGALVIVGYAAKQFSGVSWDTLGQMGAALGVLALVMVLVSKFAKAKDCIMAAAGILILSASLVVIAKAFQMISGVSIDDNALMALGVSLALLAVIAVIAGEYGAKIIAGAVGVALIAVGMGIMGLALRDIAGVLPLFDAVSGDALKRAGLVVLAVFVMVAAITAVCLKFGGKGYGAVFAGIVATILIVAIIGELAIALSLITDPLNALGKVDLNALRYMEIILLSISALVLVFGAIVGLGGAAGLGVVFAGIVSMILIVAIIGELAIALALIAPALSALGSVSTESLGRMTELLLGITALVLILGAVVGIGGGMGIATMIGGILSMIFIVAIIGELAIAIGMLVGPLNSLANVDVEGLSRMEELILAISAIVMIFGSVEVLTGGLGAAVVIAGIVTFALILLLIVGLGHTLESFAESLDIFATVAKKLENIDIQTFCDNLGALFKAFTSWDAIKSGAIGDFTSDGLKTIVTAIKEISETLTSDSFNKLIKNSYKFPWLRQALKQLFSVFTEDTGLIESFVSGLKGSGLKNALNDVANGINAFGEGWEKYGVGFMTFVTIMAGLTSLGDAFLDSAGKIEDGCEDIRSAIKELTDGLGRDVETAMNTVMNNFVKAINDKAGDARTAMQNVAASARNGIYNSSTTQMFFAVGQYMINGLIGGLTSGANRVYTVCYYIARMAVSAAEAAARISSPSKEFYRIGDYMGQGLVLGIENQEDKVYKTSYALADKAVDAAYTLSSAIEAAMSDELEPVITPVLDLSNIRSSSSQIDAILGTETFSTRGISVNASKISAQRLDTLSGIQNKASTAQTVKFDAAQMSQLMTAAQSNSDVNVSVNFEGNLAQLASILQPAIVKETNRRGPSLINA